MAAAATSGSLKRQHVSSRASCPSICLNAALALLRSQPAAQVWPEVRIGAAYARAGAVEKASRLLQELRRKANRQVAEEIADHHQLQGEALLARGETVPAIEVLTLPDQPANPALRRLCLSRAHDRDNAPEKAIALRDEVIGNAGCARAAHLLGVVEGLWKNAEPGLPRFKKIQQLRSELGSR